MNSIFGKVGNKMEKKFKFSDKPGLSKLVYGAVIAILCITAIVIGIVSASSKTPDENPPVENPPISDGEGNNNTPGGDTGKDDNLTFVAPTVGTVVKSHSLSMPVFSLTLGEWRVHTGIDISCEEGASVYASEDGKISGIYSDPMLGYTVEITHNDDIKTRYSNLNPDLAAEIKVGDTVKSGDKIGTVGDSSVSELAEEPHLHFEVIVKDVKVNPLDYISEDSKKSSLGIDNNG